MVCNGTTYLQATYPDLWTAIGYSWGSADATHFRVPDLRDRALYGAGSVVQLGQTDGRSTGNRGGPNHHHNLNTGQADSSTHGHGGSAVSTPNHDHGPGFPSGLNWFYLQPGAVGVICGTGTYSATSPGGQHGHSLSVTGGSHGHNLSGETTGGYAQDAPSFAGVTYVISAGMTTV